MVVTHADESPLGFAGDVDGSYSYRLSPSSGQQQTSPSPNNSNASFAASGGGAATAPVKLGLLPPPSLQDGGLVGGGVLLTGAQAGRSVLAWRAQESGLWLEERGLDDDLDGGGLHLKLQGGVSIPRAVGVFGGEGGEPDQSAAVAVCAYTDDAVVHRVVLQRPVAPPGEKAPSVLSAMGTPHTSETVRLACREGRHGPSCWINRNLLVIGGADGSLHCVRVVDGVDGQAASLSEETLRAKSSWNPLSGGGGGCGAKAVAITGFWQEEEKQAMVLTLHTDWSFRVWALWTTATARVGSRRGGSLLHKIDARQFLGPSHQHQTAAVDGSGCFLSPVVGQEGYVVAAVAAEGGLPIHMVLLLPASGAEPEKRAVFEAPSEAGPLVDAYVDDNLTIWALWARPRGGAGGAAGAFEGGVCSYGNMRLNVVHHQTIDQWLGREAEEDGVFDDLFRTRGGWAGLVSLRYPRRAGGARAVAFAAVELMESFYLRRMFTGGRFGRRALSSAIREALPLLSAAGPLSSNSTSLQELQDLALKGVRDAAEQTFRTLDGEEDGEAGALSQTAQQALADVHAFWKRLLAACVGWGRDEARPLGLVPGGADEFANPFVIRAGRTACLMPRAGRGGPAGAPLSAAVAGTTFSTGGGGDGGRVSRLRELASGVPAAFEEALMSGAGVADGGVGGAGLTAAGMFRGFELESALAREGTAGGLADADGLAQGGGLEEEGYRREQFFLKNVTETLLRSAAGARLAEAAATVLQADAVRDVLTWTESRRRRTAQSRPLGHRGGVRGRSAGIATAAAFGTVKFLKGRSEEARNTAVVLMLVLEQIGRAGLPEQLEVNIVADALPLALKCINQYAMAAEVGSHHLRVRAGGGTAVSSLGGGLGGGFGAAGGAQPATVAALKPWGCTALEGLFLDGQGVVQDYWAMMADASERSRVLGLGGLPTLLAGMCEGTLRSPLRGLDSGGLVAFLHTSEQYQLALPLVGLAVEWQWRMKIEPETAVLTDIAKGFLYSAEAAARSEGGGGLSAGPLLDQATKWYIKASQALRASLFRPGGGGGAEVVVAHFENALEEVERVRDRVKRGGREGRPWMGARMGLGAGRGGTADEMDEGDEDFGGRGAVNALELARAALAAERKLRPSSAAGAGKAEAEQQRWQQQRRARLCQVVFKHASEALLFQEAFAAVCENPVDQQRKANLEALAQHMCESGRLGDLCLLTLDDCPASSCPPVSGDRGWRPSRVVDDALWGLARGSNVADLVEGGGAGAEGVGGRGGRKRSRRRRGGRANYFDCLYALYMARGRAVEAARAQDELRERLEAHAAASTLPFVAAAQRARLAALNALAVAPVPYDYTHGSPAPSSSAATTTAEPGDDCAVASICPPVEERRLDSAGHPAGVRTAAVLGREAVAAAAAIVVAEDAVALNAAAAAAAAEEEEEEEEGWAATGGDRKTDGFAGKYSGGYSGGYSGAIVAAAGAGKDVSVTVVTRAGAGGVLEALRSAGRFEEAADVALSGLDQPRTMADEMNKVVRDLALACVKAEDIAQGFEHGPVPPLERGVGPLKPRVPPSAARTDSTSAAVTVRAEATGRAASLWPVLRQLLRLDSSDNGFSYHATAAKVLLEGMPASKLPRWLEDSYLGRPQLLPDPPSDANAFPPPQPRGLLAPWKVFTPGSGGGGDCARVPPNPAVLLDMYVFDGRLEEACLLLSRLLDVDVANVTALTKLTPETSGGTDFLPYASIDRLFALCEASLARQSTTPGMGMGKGAATGLSCAFEMAQDRLIKYFKIAKATSDQAQSNRVAASAASAAAVGGKFSSTSVFMLTD
eukprot:g12510.t1